MDLPCWHVQVDVAVTLEVFPRMWHDFVMYSEGCGGDEPKPLQEASTAIAHVAEFFQGCDPPEATGETHDADADAGLATE